MAAEKGRKVLMQELAALSGDWVCGETTAPVKVDNSELLPTTHTIHGSNVYIHSAILLIIFKIAVFNNL